MHKCKSCSKIIVTEYLLDISIRTGKFQKFLESNPLKPEWPDPIKDLKVPNGKTPPVDEPSKFADIYFESLKAEKLGLSEIAGMGFRKAVEFLVKDWAIHLKPSDREK